MTVPVYPSQTSSSCIKFHRESPGSDEAKMCRVPLGFDNNIASSPISGLMSLKAYLSSGHEGVPDAKILVCVLSVGPRKIIKSRPRTDKPDGVDLAMVEVGVFDETASCVLKLWEDKAASAKSWIANQTVLLISNPRCRLPDKKTASPELGISITSLVEVNPAFPDADWLRQIAMSRTKRNMAYVKFPQGLWETETPLNGQDRPLLTLADIDKLVREDPNKRFTARLNLIILGARIVENWRNRTLCCSEWFARPFLSKIHEYRYEKLTMEVLSCGIPLYANRPTMVCKRCSAEQCLTLNPHIIGRLADETGSVALGKLMWSERAWMDLFFRGGNYSAAGHIPRTSGGVTDTTTGSKPACSWKELTGPDPSGLRAVEEQLLYSRITLTVGWFSEAERLCVLSVQW